MTSVTNNMSELKEQLAGYHEKLKKANKDISKRDDQIIALKTEFASVQERLKLREEDVSEVRNI